MGLANEVEKLAAEKTQMSNDSINQLKIADSIERTLEKIGVTVQPKFEIPLGRRVNFITSEDNKT